MIERSRSLAECAQWTAVLITVSVLGELVPDSRYAQLIWLVYVLLVAIAFGALILSRATVDRLASSALKATIALAIVIHLVMGPIYYRGRAIHARVVRVADGRPVPNAVVDVRWQLCRFGGIESDKDAGLMRADRVITDASGEFAVPAWAPVLRPPFRWLAYVAPGITVSVDGHVLASVQNRAEVVRRNGQIIVPRYRQTPFSSVCLSEWSGLDIAVGAGN